MIGACSLRNRMWFLDMRNELNGRNDKILSRNPQENSIYELRKQKEIVEFWCQSIWNPVLDTWLLTVKAGVFLLWLGIMKKSPKDLFKYA